LLYSGRLGIGPTAYLCVSTLAHPWLATAVLTMSCFIAQSFPETSSKPKMESRLNSDDGGITSSDCDSRTQPRSAVAAQLRQRRTVDVVDADRISYQPVQEPRTSDDRSGQGQSEAAKADDVQVSDVNCTVSKKTVRNYVCPSLVKFSPTAKIFGTKMTERISLYEVCSFFTSPNLCQRTTISNADVPNCYITLQSLVRTKLSTLAHDKPKYRLFNRILHLECSAGESLPLQNS